MVVVVLVVLILHQEEQAGGTRPGGPASVGSANRHNAIYRGEFDFFPVRRCSSINRTGT